MRKALEAYEASKPNPEPVAYKACDPSGCILVSNKESAEKLASEYGDGKHQPLYTLTPTREPLIEDKIWEIFEHWFKNDNSGNILTFARAIEQAHGIGV